MGQGYVPWNSNGRFKEWDNYGQERTGTRKDGTTYTYNHTGDDFAAPSGTPIPAADDGTVVYSGWINGYGWTVITENSSADGSQYFTLYAHMKDKSNLKKDDPVSEGYTVGNVGSTGHSTGSHLHTEIRKPDPNHPLGENEKTPGNILKLPTNDPTDYDGWGPNGPYHHNPNDPNPTPGSGSGTGSGSGSGSWPGAPGSSSGPGWGPTGPGGGVSGANRIIVSWDPLLIDLNGDGIKTIASTSGTFFDYDGNGFAERMGWASSDDGILVLDRNNDGIINDGSELFGDQTVLSTGRRAANGFQALADLDSNADGKIDINDTAYTQLRVWQDIDNDGYSLDSELFTLEELGISSLNLSSTGTGFTDANGNTQTLAGTYTKTDGTTGQIANYNLHTDAIYTIPETWVEVPEDIAPLPDLQGYGNVYDLHQAMAMDTTGELKALVEQFMAEEDPVTRKNIMEQILFQWTDSADITQNRGSMDGRQLATLEKFSGENFANLINKFKYRNAWYQDTYNENHRRAA